MLFAASFEGFQEAILDQKASDSGVGDVALVTESQEPGLLGLEEALDGLVEAPGYLDGGGGSLGVGVFVLSHERSYSRVTLDINIVLTLKVTVW